MKSDLFSFSIHIFTLLFLVCGQAEAVFCQSPHTELICDEFTKNMPDPSHLWSDSVGVWWKTNNTTNQTHRTWMAGCKQTLRRLYTWAMQHIVSATVCNSNTVRSNSASPFWPSGPSTHTELLWLCFHSVRLLSCKFTLSATRVVSETILFFFCVPAAHRTLSVSCLSHHRPPWRRTALL